MQHPAYVEKQWFKFLWIFMPLITLFTLGSQYLAGMPVASWMALSVPLVNAIVLVFLGSLTIQIDATHLQWRFGWLGWPCWKLTLADIQSVEAVTTTFIDGWGIKKTRQGMLYNASGTQAIRLQLRNGKSLRLGTQDAQRLLSYISPRLNGR